MGARPARLIVAGLAGPLLACLPAAADDDAVGSIERMQGECAGELADGTPQHLAAGDDVFMNETVTTGTEARLALTLLDGTSLTIGENARLVINAFIYRPAGETVLYSSITGAFRFISGTLPAGATRQATVTTPVAWIGVRGTDFWGGQIDGTYGVVVLEGSVTVATPAGTTVLSAPGQGTSIAGPGAAPGAVVTWSQEKIGRAAATVTFQ